MFTENTDQSSKRYPWPADKISTFEMGILYRLREATGKPINQLLREAILKLSEITNVETTGEQNAETE